MKNGAAVVEQGQDEMLKMVQQGQEALVTGIRSWAEIAKPLIPNGTGFPFAKLVPLGEMVERYFDFGDQLLATQREFCRAVLSAAEGGRRDGSGTDAPAPARADSTVFRPGTSPAKATA
jgi:hypothetical protein